MFFHSNEEKRLAQVFGVTDDQSVTLINRNHPFPLLVEEEERIHGTLIANTTHGALFRALGRISTVPNFLSFKFTIAPDAQGLPSAGAIVNTMNFLRDETALNAIPTHEGFAKHIAYSFQFQMATAAERPKLQEYLNKDRAKYRILDTLSRRFCDPARNGAAQLANVIGYQAAKVVLNITDLSELLCITNPKDLWNRLKKGGFASNLERRTNVVINALEDFVSEKKSSPAHDGDFFGFVADWMRESGLEAPEDQDSAWLVSQAALLGKRIEALAEGVYCSETAPFLGWSYGKDGEIQIDSRYLSETGEIQVYDIKTAWDVIIRSDPALQVFCTPNYRGGNWRIGDIQDLDPAGWDQLAVYVTPAFEPTGEPSWRHGSTTGDMTLRVHLYCFGLTAAGPRSVAISYVDWWDTQEKFAEFPDDSLVFVANEPSIPGPTISMAPVDELANLLGNHAPVVYWKQVAGPWLLSDNTAVIYDPPGDEAARRSADRGPCAVIRRHGNYTMLTCVPKYVIDTVHSAARRILGKDFYEGSIKDRAARTLGATSDRDAWSAGPILAYNLMYEQAILPESLPYYSGYDLFQFLDGNL